MDVAGDDLAGGDDRFEADDVVGHPRQYRRGPGEVVAARPDARHVPAHLPHLRTCARSDTIRGMPTSATISSDTDRVRFAAVGRALADPKRLCVLESLAAGELSVSDLSTRVGCQVPNMSQHLAVLRTAGLVTTRRDGQHRLLPPRGPRVLEAYALIQTLAR